MIFDRFYDSVLIRFVQIVIERQAQQTIADGFGNGTIAFLTAKGAPHAREMKRLIMKNGIDPLRAQMTNQSLALFQ